MQCLSLVIADRYPMVLNGLRAFLGTCDDFDIVACCTDGRSCLEALRNLAPDVAILDPALPGMTAREILAVSRSEQLATRLVFFMTLEEDSELVVSAPANGYGVISKDVTPRALLRSLRRIAKDKMALRQRSEEKVISRTRGAFTQSTPTMLTHRENEIMRLVSEGLSNREIGSRLNISGGTVKVHLQNIFKKLEVNNRIGVMKKAATV